MTTLTPLKTNEHEHDEHDEQLDAILADYLAQLDRGEAVDVRAFCERYPAAAAELREFVEMGGLLEQLSQGPAGSGAPLGVKSTADALGTLATLADVGSPPAMRKGVAAMVGNEPQGVRFGRYYLLGLLGEGSMGAVQLAYDTELDRMIALKTPRFVGAQSAAVIERFRREARASADVRHPNICPIFDVGTIDGVHYLSMAYIEGESLAQLLDRDEQLPLDRILQLVRKLAEALHEAHRHDVIHRDLKPANIVLDGSGEPIITDFGLARRLDMRETLLTQTGMLVGTLAFMSPEQLEGDAAQIGRPADIYSLGVIFYQMLTGRLPYSGGFLSVVLQIRAGQPQRPSELRPELLAHPEVEAVCLKMMAARPEDRYTTMEEVVAAMAALPDEPPQPPIASPAAELEPECDVPPPLPRIDPNSDDPPQLIPARSTWQRWAIGGLASLASVLLLVLAYLSTGGFSQEEAKGSPPSEKDRFTTPAQQPKPTQTPPVASDRDSTVVNKPTLTDPPASPTENPPSAAIDPPEPTPPAETPEAVKPFVREAPAQIEITSRRSATEKFGVARVEVIFPAGDGWEYRPDWSCRISSTDNRVFYPTYKIELVGDDAPLRPAAPVRGQLQRLTASFLTYGKEPLHVDLSYGGRSIVAQRELPIDIDVADQPVWLREWWATYTQPPREPLNEESRLLKTYLHDMLARRMNLPSAKPLPRSEDDASMLERMFERSMGKFLGFDSVQVALGEQDVFRRPSVEPLTESVPPPPRIASVPFPEPPHQVSIETIASHVPDDCVYLRCHSLDNYLWFRDLLLSWGGGLNEVVSPRRLDRQVRERLERQLALSPDADAQVTLKTAISDLALVFGDTCFEDGAAVGVLFQAKNEAQLKGLLQRQRASALQEFAAEGAKEQLVRLANDEVSLISTTDKRLRSFYARSGKFHLITNSQYLVKRFFECSQGQRSLGSLKEFRYARSKVRLDDAQDVFLYMPDPFFQRIIGPQHQIEMGRRQRAKADVQHLELARLAAKGEGYHAERVSHLMETGFLPENFTTRSDRGSALLQQQAEDSQRGIPGTFVPICDMDVRVATRSEVQDYYRFSNQYRSEYRMMDPVAVVASHRKTGDGRQTVDIEITITPYALQTYAGIRSALSAPQSEKIVGLPSELLSLRGSLRTPDGTPFLALAAIHDTTLKFQVVDGAVVVDGYIPGESFAGKNWQLAFDQLDPDCLQSLSHLTGMPGSGISAVMAVEHVIGQYASLMGRIISVPNWRDVIPKTTPQSGPGWQVRAAREELRKAPFEKKPSSETRQIRLRLKGLQGTQIEPYIQAYTFLEARRASARQAALLEFTMQQFCLKPEGVGSALESIYSAKFLCPLDGQLNFTTQGAAQPSLSIPEWRSSRWTSSSLYDETATPKDYHFPFTDWLRNLDVGFSLDNQTLSADVQLEVLPRSITDRSTERPKQPALKK